VGIGPSGQVGSRPGGQKDNLAVGQVGNKANVNEAIGQRDSWPVGQVGTRPEGQEVEYGSWQGVQKGY
jgi:hypothetical protein